MRLRLAYDDRYRLWKDLVHSPVDRIFVPTAEPVRVATDLVLEVELSGTAEMIEMTGQVVGRRGRSRRFPPGAYVRIARAEQDKCLRLLGLRNPPQSDPEGVRRFLRVSHPVELRFIEPNLSGPLSAKDISEIGVFVAGEVPLKRGGKTVMELAISGEPLRTEGTVVWVAPDQSAAGLEFAGLAGEDALRLRDFLAAIIEKRKGGAGPRKYSIVVADEDPAILVLLTRALTRHGHNVYQAADGDEAIDLTRRLHPNLVILDVLLPLRDGEAVCRILRADAEMWRIPVVMLSALDPLTMHSIADSCGATDYLSKPPHLGELLGVVDGILCDSGLA